MILFIIALCSTIGFVSALCVGISKGFRFVRKQHWPWSLGIYIGKSPLIFSPQKIKNPVLTAQDVHDVPARFLADPFMVYEAPVWYMFFEVFNERTHQGDIGLAASRDGFHWAYKQIVLHEPFHLSYPYVFKWEGEYYMIPETYKSKSIRLYKATDFPTKWSIVVTLLKGEEYVDSSIFRFKDQWWLFTSLPKSDTLFLYYANSLTGPWLGHPQNPIIREDAHIARPGGRVLVEDGKIFRYTQDDSPRYGSLVRAFRITKLTPEIYEEEAASENPILKPGRWGWNSEGMHHIDPHLLDKNKWIACVDGYGAGCTFFGFKEKKNKDR